MTDDPSTNNNKTNSMDQGHLSSLALLATEDIGQILGKYAENGQQGHNLFSWEGKEG